MGLGFNKSAAAGLSLLALVAADVAANEAQASLITVNASGVVDATTVPSLAGEVLNASIVFQDVPDSLPGNLGVGQYSNMPLVSGSVQVGTLTFLIDDVANAIVFDSTGSGNDFVSITYNLLDVGNNPATLNMFLQGDHSILSSDALVSAVLSSSDFPNSSMNLTGDFGIARDLSGVQTNFTVDAGAYDVPEPGTVFLLGAGLAGLGRRQISKAGGQALEAHAA